MDSRQRLRLPDRRRRVRRILLGLAGVLIAAQVLSLAVFRRDNPPVRSEPDWSLAPPEVRQLAVDACFDCHSNETVWPWYSWVFPASWLVWTDVDGGRASGNFSEWDTHPMEADEIEDEIRAGRMPPEVYSWLHPEADLSRAEQQALIDGMYAITGAARLEDEEDDD